VSQRAVEQLLTQHIGLDVAALGASAFPAAVAEHMRVLGVRDEGAYAVLLGQNPDRLEELVERLIVSETCFFRTGELFRHLATAWPTLLAARAPDRPWRALSLPCSTGEEPYSLALTLLEAGAPAERFRIDAVDVSRRSVDAARRGLYREFSFRQTPPELRRRYFQPVAATWELSADVRRLVNFRLGNLLDPVLTLENARNYDLILCRNLLIYFTPERRRQAVEHLDTMLAPDGWLAVGHAEAHVLADRAYRRVGPDSCFLFARSSDAATPPLVQRATLPTPAISWTGRAAVSSTARATPAAAPVRAPAAPGSLQRARALADANRLDEALAECQGHLAQVGPSADGYALLGLVQQARGNIDDALEAFRKTLYLDPRHAEVLTHTMLLSAQRGDVQRAALMRDRLARLQAGDEP
jgi:chemotaxis protein methyltransferase WspC